VSSAVTPNTTYRLRVLGWANGPSTYSISATQLLPQGSQNENAGTRTSEGTILSTGTANPIQGVFRFTVNPITRKITFSLLR